MEQKQIGKVLQMLIDDFYEQTGISREDYPLMYADDKRIFFGKDLKDDDYFIRVYDTTDCFEFSYWKTKGEKKKLCDQEYWLGEKLGEYSISSSEEGLKELAKEIEDIGLTEKELKEKFG